MTITTRLQRTAAMVLAGAALLTASAAPAAAGESDGVVLISATTLDRGQTEQTYTLTVINTGDQAAAVTTRSSAPISRRVVSYSADLGTFSTHNGQWVIGRLAPGAAATLTVIAT